jgi:hypothetical protein
MSASTASANRRSSRALSPGATRRQVAKARSARSTRASISARSAKRTVSTIDSSTGLITSKVTVMTHPS